LVCPFALLKSPHKESFIPLVFVPIIGNVIEQNLIGFPNSMFFHVEPYRPYRPYFGYGYSGLGIVPAMLPPMFSPFTNITIAPKPILGVA